MTLEEIKESVEVIKAYRQMLTDSVSNQIDEDIKAFDVAVEAMEREACGDCISRVDAMRAITDEWVRGKHTLESFTAALYNLPAVTPDQPVMTGPIMTVPVMTGEWVTTRTQAESEENG